MENAITCCWWHIARQIFLTILHLPFYLWQNTLMRNSEFYTPYLLHCSPQDKRRTFSTQVDASLDLNLNTVKPFYKGHSRKPDNIAFYEQLPFIYILFINGGNQIALYRKWFVLYPPTYPLRSSRSIMSPQDYAII